MWKGSLVVASSYSYQFGKLGGKSLRSCITQRDGSQPHTPSLLASTPPPPPPPYPPYPYTPPPHLAAGACDLREGCVLDYDDDEKQSHGVDIKRSLAEETSF